MPAKSVVVTCKRCGCDLKMESGWNFCPKCGDKLACGGTYKATCGRSSSPKPPGK